MYYNNIDMGQTTCFNLINEWFDLSSFDEVNKWLY